MPLYTYIVSFKGATFVAQDRKSNFKGFVSSWTSDIPAGALPGLTPALQDKLRRKAYEDEFQAVPNKTHVWRKEIDLEGSVFTVHAVQTEP